ncbi:hypothetical protein [Methylobacter sp.]|uniref:hypothetical protein n=1 Tax=Methylobacter sp. TaxID=2051955 RepID=UPI001220FA72|nr:hypothetical protein [Methylobacter sp.]TAK61706.1 MAG: hypothetical protein EPO18_12960 [Methylobacter sp.]
MFKTISIMNSKILFAIVAAAVTGLPQGINAKPLLKAPVVPEVTIYIIIAFGLISGIAMAFNLIKERTHNKSFISKYIDLYTYFVVGVLCIGLPIFIQNQGINWQSNVLFNGYFFTAAGIGLVIGGGLNYVIKKT